MSIKGLLGNGGLATASKERPMRKWFVPLTVLGVSGVGAFLLTAKGRETLRRWSARFESTPEKWDDWNESAQLELERIQDALNQIAKSLQPGRQASH